MAEDQFDDFDNEVTLSADPEHDSAADFGAPAAKPRSSKRGLIVLLLVLILLAGGGFFAYQNFLAEPEMPIQPARPIDVAAAPNNNLPAQVTPGVANPVVPADPNALPAPTTAANPAVPGAPTDAATIAPVDPTKTDPNAVSATALPTPVPPGATAQVTPVDPNAPATPSALPEPVVAGAAAIKPVDPVPAAAGKAIQNDLKTADAKPAVAEVKADVKPAEAVPVTGTLEGKSAAVKEDKKEADAKPVIPAPSEQQLKPIDPKDEVSKIEDDATKPASQIRNLKNDAEKKTADTIAAVNDILGKELPSSGNKTIDDTISKATGKKSASKAAAPAPPQEVTSRAEQVIKVKKAYSAQSSQAINAAGDRVLDANQYEEAIQLYNKQLNSNPSDPSALAGKGLALQKAGRDTEAMDVYQRLTELNPRDVEALTNYLGLLQKQKPEEAMTRLNTLSEQYPDNAAVAGQIGAVFASQMDTPNALRYFIKAQAIDKTNPTYPFNAAVLYDRMGTYEKAGEYYRRALSTAESNPENASGVPLEAIRGRLRSIDN